MTGAFDRDLVLCYLTLQHLLPPAFVSVAAEAGYQGISVRLIPVRSQPEIPMFGNSGLLAETIERLDATGVYVNDIEVLQLAEKLDVSALERVLETSARLRARNLIALVNDPEEARAADNLARVAQLSASYGLRTCLECIAYTAVKTLDQGLRVIEQTGDAGIGLVIDPLHIDRAGGGPADVQRLPPGRIACVQLCDAGPRPDLNDIDALILESVVDRRVPGTGMLPLREFMAILPPDVPVELEVPAKGFAGVMPDLAVASTMLQAAREILARCGQESTSANAAGPD